MQARFSSPENFTFPAVKQRIVSSLLNKHLCAISLMIEFKVTALASLTMLDVYRPINCLKWNFTVVKILQITTETRERSRITFNGSLQRDDAFPTRIIEIEKLIIEKMFSASLRWSTRKFHGFSMTGIFDKGATTSETLLADFYRTFALSKVSLICLRSNARQSLF